MKPLTPPLLKKFRRGNTHVFQLIYDKYYESIFLFTYKFINTTSVVEDIVQDSFIKLWEKRESFYHDLSIKSFLYKTARNAALNHLDHIKVRKNYEQKISNEILSEEYLIQNIIEEEVNQKITEAINQLPESARLIYLLSLRGVKNTEIAEDLEISINTVKTQKQRSTKFLRKTLKHILTFF